ncbi:MAG: lipopolysaccharide biosynthesis protein [Ruminococcus sp.]
MSTVSIKKATLINAVSKYGKVLMNLVFTAVLSRLLSPNDYGVVAIVTVFTSFFNILADMGLGSAVVQNKELTDDEVNDIFSYSCYQGIMLAVFFCMLSVPISFFYKNKVYLSICSILSVSVLFNTLNMIPNAVLMKNKKFMTVAVRNIIATLVTGGVTILLAFLGFKYYSLVFQSVTSSFVVFIWNLKGVHLKFRFRYNKASIDKVKNFSRYQFAYNIVNYFSRNVDNILIGKIMGDEKLAYYSKGYTLMLYPIQNLTFVISPVLHPILSDHQNDKNYIYNKYIKVTKLLSLLGVFISAFCFSASREIVLIMYGNQWENAVLCFKILSLSVFSQIVSSTAGSIFQSLGKTKLMFKAGIIQMTITVSMIIIGCFLGTIETVAICVTIGLIAKFFIEFGFLVIKGFEYSFARFLKEYIPDIAIFFVLIAESFILNTYIHINSLFLSAILKFVAIAVVYAVLLILLKQTKYLLVILPKKLRKH